jgi:hypothetical protein
VSDAGFEAAAVALAVDSVTAQAYAAFQRAGVRALLLKGPSFQPWLYGPADQRPYSDTDLMVAPADFARAGEVLSGIGFAQPPEIARPTHTDHAAVWVRPDGLNVDLHRALIGVRRDPAEAWLLLAAGTETIEVAGASVECLGERARALHVALHAAEHGVGEGKTLEDLRRALDRVPLERWADAAELAEQLEAAGAFAAGLRLLPAGADVADRLGLTSGRDVTTALFAESVPYSSHFVHRMASAEGLGAKARMIGRKAAPAPGWMREWTPLARRGPLGLAAAYAYRQLWLVRHGPPALLGWLRARRSASAPRRRS